MKDKKLTMSDIAKMAGVGKSTVSRYFNGGYIKEETRLKLKKVIDENNYDLNFRTYKLLCFAGIGGRLFTQEEAGVNQQGF